MATTTGSGSVLSTCPKGVLSKLPAFPSPADGDACSSFKDTARCTLGSNATSFASVSQSLEMSVQMFVGKAQHLL